MQMTEADLSSEGPVWFMSTREITERRPEIPYEEPLPIVEPIRSPLLLAGVVTLVASLFGLTIVLFG